jgi:hypothetical protein
MNLEEFKKELDIEKPRWFIDYANEQELKEFVGSIVDGSRFYTLTHYETTLRNSVASRLFVCARASYRFMKCREGKK